MKKLFFVRFGIVVGGCALALSAVAGNTLERIKSSGTVNIGYRPAGTPFSYSVPGGNPVGYAIDLCTHLVQDLQSQYKLPPLKVNYLPVTGADRIQKIQNGTIDLECANTTNSKSRRDQVAFGLTHYYAAARMLVRDGEGINGLGDLNGKILAVSKGTTGQAIAEARLRGGSKFTLMVVDTSKLAVEAVEQGKAHATINDDVMLEAFKQESKAKLAVVGPNLSIEPLAIMMNKSDAEFAGFIGRAMTRLYADGTASKLYAQWFQQTLPHRGFNLNVKLNPLLRDNFMRPNSYVTDWTVL